MHTLRLEEDLIKQAKSFAKTQGKSKSQLVAEYFERLNEGPSARAKTPLIRSLRGALKGGDQSPAGYYDYLRAKHQ